MKLLRRNQQSGLYRIFLHFFLLVITLLLFNVCTKDKGPLVKDSYTDYEFAEPAITGNTFYIDPVNGSPEGDGSAEHPWRTLQEVVDSNLISCYRQVDGTEELEAVNPDAPVKGGDCLVLKSGYHGYFKRNVFVFNNWLTIKAAEGETPVLSQFRIEGAFAKVFLKGVTIAKDSYVGEENYWEAEAVNRNSNACVYLRTDDFWGAGHDMKFSELRLMTTENTDNWTANDWVEKAASGFGIRSVPNVEIVNCTITNISFGISISEQSENSHIVNNTIRNFSGDGARLISNDIYFGFNTITDCYKVDDNHDDAIQSYSVGENWQVGASVVRNVVIRGNTIIGTTNFNNPLAGSPQGIGCFDGMFENWVVENNLIIVDHYHGISFYGMRNSVIAHNTVIDQVPDNDISPWIRITSHKNGTHSDNCSVINNIITRSLSIEDGISNENNIVLRDNDITDLGSLFVDPANFDFHLRMNPVTEANFVNQGIYIDNINSCHTDKDGMPRDDKPELGAYELN